MGASRSWAGEADQGTQARHHRLEGLPDRRVSHLKGILGHHQAARPGRADLGLQQHRPHPGKQAGVPRKPTHGVVAGRLQQHAVQGNAPVGGAQPVETAEAGRNPDRAAGVGAQGEIDQAARHRGRRAAGGAPGNSPRGFWVQRSAVVGVDAQDAPGQLVGVGFPDHGGAGAHQDLYGPGGGFGCGLTGLPVGIAPAGHMTLDVEDVLGGESQSGQGAPVIPRQKGTAVRAEGVEFIV